MVLGQAGVGGEADPESGVPPPRHQWRSDDEIGRLYRELEPPARTTPGAEYSDDSDEPIIELEPYVVRGDTTLLLAIIRRDLELGPETIRRRVAEMAPVLSQRAELAARATGRFFAEPSAGGPVDRPSMVYVNNVQAVESGRKFGEMLDHLFNRDGGD